MSSSRIGGESSPASTPLSQPTGPSAEQAAAFSAARAKPGGASRRAPSPRPLQRSASLESVRKSMTRPSALVQAQIEFDHAMRSAGLDPDNSEHIAQQFLIADDAASPVPAQDSRVSVYEEAQKRHSAAMENLGLDPEKANHIHRYMKRHMTENVPPSTVATSSTETALAAEYPAPAQHASAPTASPVSAPAAPSAKTVDALAAIDLAPKPPSPKALSKRPATDTGSGHVDKQARSDDFGEALRQINEAVNGSGPSTPPRLTPGLAVPEIDAQA